MKRFTKLCAADNVSMEEEEKSLKVYHNIKTLTEKYKPQQSIEVGSISMHTEELSYSSSALPINNKRPDKDVSWPTTTARIISPTKT